jgi:hypothetical protein
LDMHTCIFGYLKKVSSFIVVFNIYASQSGSWK